MKKKMIIAISVLVAALVISVPVKVQAATGWRYQDNAWYYYYSDSNYYSGVIRDIEDRYYFFYDSGKMGTGWCKRTRYFDGEERTTWYYAESNGSLINGWRQISGYWYYFDPSQLYMYTGRRNIGGKTYWFADSGEMLTGWIKDSYSYDGKTYTDWYYADSSGVLQTGWLKLGNTWYYLRPDSGSMYSDWYYDINGTTYYFNEDGSMGVGWCKWTGTDGSVYWYYAESNGALVKGWKKIDGVWYYFNEDYFDMYKGGARVVKGKRYYFADSGAMQIGWCKYLYTSEGKTYVYWYYAEDNGELVNGWKKINGAWYYFASPDNRMLSGGRQRAGDKYYFFSDSGAMQTGWCKEVYVYPENTYTVWFYADSNGDLATGWKYIDGAWYYFNTSGCQMYSDARVELEDGVYFFTESGAMKANGWCRSSGSSSWYYADSSGRLAAGWKTINGAQYYFHPTYNYMYTGSRYIDDKLYNFGTDGKLIS